MVLHSFKMPIRRIPLDFTVPDRSNGPTLIFHLEGQLNLRPVAIISYPVA